MAYRQCMHLDCCSTLALILPGPSPRPSLPPKLISVTAKNKGLPIAMLAVTGLPLDNLQKAVSLASDKPPPPHPNTQVSFFNGPKAFIVTGHPFTFLGLVSLPTGKNLRLTPTSTNPRSNPASISPCSPCASSPLECPMEGCVSQIMHLVAKGGIGPGDPNWWEPKTGANLRIGGPQRLLPT
ncbi:hypothetical protein PTTG_03762 [Puccinia triticina 1-1 BBBD Race 1]|uniref:Uncharacterized protein n=1 Tax=Puccinia triticina (isolate 1-1 / race 1 (BBBD)) TaxID=630390 RepID=A0A180GIF9_PUCT1|nr:hypothetical protein PTTG_03762 [Puccinia triticina 1-1 BBBD Race 1]